MIDSMPLSLLFCYVVSVGYDLLNLTGCHGGTGAYRQNRKPIERHDLFFGLIMMYKFGDISHGGVDFELNECLLEVRSLKRKIGEGRSHSMALVGPGRSVS